MVDNRLKDLILADDWLYNDLINEAKKLQLNSINKRFILLFQRSCIYDQVIFDKFSSTLQKMNDKIEVVLFKRLSDAEILYCTQNIRGGNWLDDWGEKLSGGPVSISLLRNKNPAPLPEHKMKYFNFSILDDTYFIKETIRQKMVEISDGDISYNFFHSTDDDLELLLYSRGLNLIDYLK
jgi:hypothetical protein